MRMLTWMQWSLVGFMLAATVFPAAAAEYFVGLDGDDRHDGLSRDRAFASVQRGVDALAPGDILTILPGEYHESVRRDDLGHPDVLTVIRADVPGSVLLRGDVPAPEFQPVKGYAFVHAADFEGDVQAVNEIDTLTIFPAMPNRAELEYQPGHFYHDRAGGRLYISTTDFKPPGAHAYSISVKPDSGLYLLRPVRVVIEGLAATGFSINRLKPARNEGGTVWGLWLQEGADCVITNCVMFLNNGGIGLQSSSATGGNLVTDCRVYGNHSTFTASGGIISFNSNRDEIRATLAAGARFGIRFYSAGAGYALMDRNIILSGTAQIKGGSLKEVGIVSNTVALHNLNGHQLADTLIGGRNLKRQEACRSENMIEFEDHAGLDPEAEFADPQNHDYRLQSTSRFRASGHDGRDRGPYPFAADVFYVDPAGDDAADGLSLSTAWRTLPAALARLRANDTLYLVEGRYPSPGRLDLAGRPGVRLAGRGRAAVMVEGALHLTGAQAAALERLQFTGPVSVEASAQLRFSDCGFHAGGTGLVLTGSGPVMLEHNRFGGFADAGVLLRQCARVLLRGNLFDNRDAPAVDVDALQAISYSDYNGFSDTARVWRIGTALAALPAVPAGFERYSRQLAPVFEPHAGLPVLTNPELFLGQGPLGTPIGTAWRLPRPALRMAGPRVHSVSATSVNLTWQTTQPATCTVEWGATPACGHAATVHVYRFGSFSITNLAPGTAGYFRIRSVVTPRDQEDLRELHPLGINTNVIAFATLQADGPPRILHVDPEGDDELGGLDRENAWRTINHAAAMARPGDTVLVAGGTYDEQIRFPVTGTRERPMVFRGRPGERAVIAGGGQLLQTLFVLSHKHDIEIDHFYIEDVNMMMENWSPHRGSGVFNLIDCERVSVSRILYDGRRQGYAPRFMVGHNVAELAIRNCVIVRPMHAMTLNPAPELLIENNVVLGCQITILSAGNRPGAGTTWLRNNIFSDNLFTKLNSQPISVSGGLVEDNNCYFFRVPAAERKFFRLREIDAETLPELQAALPAARPSLVRDPRLAFMDPLRDYFSARFEELGERFPGRPYYEIDLIRNAGREFSDFFSTDPELLDRGIGLQPEAFDAK